MRDQKNEKKSCFLETTAVLENRDWGSKASIKKVPISKKMSRFCQPLCHFGQKQPVRLMGQNRAIYGLIFQEFTVLV